MIDGIYKAYHAGDKEKSKKLLREMTKGFVAVSDAPCCQFVEELMEIYPDAIVICATRDPKKWWQSMKPVADNASTPGLSTLVWPIAKWRVLPSAIAGLTQRHVGFCQTVSL
jgi:hypothetical protein